MAILASMLIQALAECITRDGDREVYMTENCQTVEGVEEVDGVSTRYGGPAEGGTHFVIV